MCYIVACEEIMKKKLLYVLSGLIIISAASCFLFTPDYVGTWVDSTTVPGTTITLEFERDEFLVTVDLPELDPDTVAQGTLEKNRDTLTATLISLDYYGQEYTGALLETVLINILELPGPVNSVTYSVSGDTMTIQGELILKLTKESDTLTAVKSAD